MTLHEEVVRTVTSAEAFARGREYQQQGRVLELVLRGSRLYAEVQGGQSEPYQVTATLEEEGVSRARCTCRVGKEGQCKHVAATLLQYAADPSAVEHHPPLADLLAPLDRDTLHAILLELADHDPVLAGRIEAQAVRHSPGSTVTAALPPLDEVSLRRGVRAAFRAAADYRRYDYEGLRAINARLLDVLTPIDAYLQADQGRAALPLLRAVADELIGSLHTVHDEPRELHAAVEKLGDSLAEAILTADLSDAELDEWEEVIDAWHEVVYEEGYDEAFALAAESTEYGWSDPGEDAGETDEKDPYVPLELYHLQSRILERRGDWNAYLDRAEKAGLTALHAAALVRLGRKEEALVRALAHITHRSDALIVARAFEASGAVEEALALAEHALSTLRAHPFPADDLPAWLRDAAGRHGRPDLVLLAAVPAFKERPSLASYQAVRDASGERWPELREELLGYLRGLHSGHLTAKVDIFLEEGFVEEAMAALDDAPHSELLDRVGRAAAAAHPDWTLRAYVARFESLAQRGATECYPEAALWLEKARDVLRSAGREDEWPLLLARMREEYGRKHKLRPLLDALR